ncbi:MAG: hypothetical protein U0637_04610 [Phycisphaerales bacterium]
MQTDLSISGVGRESGSPVGTPQLVEGDRGCATCGYNLRGLAVGARCPECALPVEDSLRENLLAYSGYEYRRRLIIGFHAVFWGTVLSVALSLLSSVLMVVLAGLGAAYMGGAGQVMGILRFALNVVTLGGIWLVVLPDPGVGADRDAAGARRWVRACVLVSAVAWLVAWLISVWGPASISGVRVAGAAPALWWWLVYVPWIVGGIAQALLAWWVCVYLGWVAVRIPSRVLAGRAGRRRWWVSLLRGSQVFQVGYTLLVVLWSSPAIMGMLWVFNLVSQLMMIVAMALFAGLLWSICGEVVRIHRVVRADSGR